ncbi:MAG: hypothetical protein VXZ35_04215, partial [Pseudomonadota bacterium]|nr:hypothetical protein [Pseudomonadota bacterium]
MTISESANEGNDTLDLSLVDSNLVITMDNTATDKNKLQISADGKTVTVVDETVDISHTTTGGAVTFDAGQFVPVIPVSIEDISYSGFSFWVVDAAGELREVTIDSGVISEEELRALIGSVEALEEEIISNDVSDAVETPIPDVDVKPGNQLWMSLVGNIAFWNSDKTAADTNANRPDAYVENGTTSVTDINLSQFFSVPSDGVAQASRTFTLALGYQSATAVDRAAHLIEVQLPAKTYSGSASEIKAQWAADIQTAINTAINLATPADIGDEVLKAPVSVNQVFGRISMVADSGSIAFWNSDSASGHIDHEVRGSGDAGAESLLMQYFDAP